MSTHKSGLHWNSCLIALVWNNSTASWKKTNLKISGASYIGTSKIMFLQVHIFMFLKSEFKVKMYTVSVKWAHQTYLFLEFWLLKL